MNFTYLIKLVQESNEQKLATIVQLPDGGWRRVDVYGNIYYSKTKDGMVHRLDGPAITLANGSEKWLVDGKLHRTDGPAVINAYGDKWWYVNDERHRLDGPAVKYASGSEEWYVNNRLHRVGGPAVTSTTSPVKEQWRTNGELNRLDGPAVIYINGGEKWYKNDKLHRTDGPAVTHEGGRKYWFVDDKEYSEEDFNAIFGVSKDTAIIKQRAASNNLFM